MNIDPHTGRTIDGWTEFVQRIHTVLTTPLHTRVKRRRFGCRLHELQGHAQTPALLRRATAHVAAAFYHPANQLHTKSNLLHIKCSYQEDKLILNLTLVLGGVRETLIIDTAENK